MIWEQRENVKGQPVFVTEAGGREYVVAQLEGEPGWWLIPENIGGLRSLRGLLQHALVEAAGFIREASDVDPPLRHHLHPHLTPAR